MDCDVVCVADPAVGETPRSSVLLDHSVELIDCLSGISSVSESLITAAGSCLEEQERRVQQKMTFY